LEKYEKKERKEESFLALFPVRLILGCKGTSATCYGCLCNSDICVISRTFISNSMLTDQDCACSARTIDVYYNVTLISKSFCITGTGCLSLIKTHRVCLVTKQNHFTCHYWLCRSWHLLPVLEPEGL